MKIKKWHAIFAGAIALLVIVISPLAIFAANDVQTDAVYKPQMEGGLAIVAPRVALAGQDISIGVFCRQDQTPVSDVNIWGITKEDAETLRNEISALKDKGPNLTESDYEAVLSGRAFRIGKTGDDGKLSYTFQETGNFVMIAFKAHYWPDIAGVAVREKPVLTALSVQAPARAAINESVTITVLQRGTGDTVKDASVWAICRDNISALQEEVAILMESGDAQNADLESVVQIYGFKLGETNSAGILKAEFDNAGGYLLLGLKKGNLPGRSRIIIVDPQLIKQEDVQPIQ